MPMNNNTFSMELVSQLHNNSVTSIGSDRRARKLTIDTHDDVLDAVGRPEHVLDFPFVVLDFGKSHGGSECNGEKEEDEEQWVACNSPHLWLVSGAVGDAISVSNCLPFYNEIEQVGDFIYLFIYYYYYLFDFSLKKKIF